MDYTIGNKALESPYSKLPKLFGNRLNRYREIATQTWPKIYTFVRFAAKKKEDCDVISGQHVKTIEDYFVVNFEVACSKKIIS